MTDINYLESEQKEAWKRIVELETNAEVIRKDMELYKKPIPDDVKYIKGARNCISEMRNKSKDAFSQVSSYLLETKKSLEEIKSFCEEAKTVNTIVANLRKKETNITAQDNSITLKLSNITKKITEIEAVYANIANITTQVNKLTSNFSEGQDAYNKILTLHQDALKKRNDITSLHNEILGYTEKDASTGKEKYIEGLKDELENSYNEINDKLSKTDDDLNKLKAQKEEQYKAFLVEWKSQYDSLKKNIESLLPGALTAGLSSAYATKKRVERQESKLYAKTFGWAIAGLIIVSLLPIIGGVLLIIYKGQSLDDVLIKLPTMSLGLLPMYAPLLWVAYSADKKLKLSKRLIEEYTHKEVVSKTYYGLADQLQSVKEKEKSLELKNKLLENLIAVNSDNPGKLITDYNKSNNPMLDLINCSTKFVNSIDKVSKSIERLKKA